MMRLIAVLLSCLQFVRTTAATTTCPPQKTGECAQGEYKLKRTGGCVKCPTDATCDGSENIKCKNDMQMHFEDGDRYAACFKCPAEATCDGSRSITCKEGAYEKDGNCKKCPTGATCTNGEVKCDKDSYARDNGRTLVCLKCPTGATCDGSQGYSCSKDSPLRSNHGCSPCPTGATCKDGHLGGDCEKDTYEFSENGARSCKQCPTGGTCKDGNLHGCKKDYFRDHRFQTCTQCPTGATCDGSHEIKCEKDGYTSDNDGVKSCHECPDGVVCENGNAKCCDGKLKISALGNTAKCVDCPTGGICEGGDLKLCTTGKYRLPHSQVSCLDCPTGATCFLGKVYCADDGFFLDSTLECKTCPAGATCDGSQVLDCGGSGMMFSGRVAGCVKCPAGATCDGISTVTCGSNDKFRKGDTCSDCPTGYTCDGSRILKKTSTGPIVPVDNLDIYVTTDNTGACAKGVPIDDEATCIKMGDKYLHHVGTTNGRFPYWPSGCILLSGTYGQNGFVFNKNGWKEGSDWPLDPKVQKVCTLALGPASHRSVSLSVYTAVVLSILSALF